MERSEPTLGISQGHYGALQANHLKLYELYVISSNLKSSLSGMSFKCIINRQLIYWLQASMGKLVSLFIIMPFFGDFSVSKKKNLFFNIHSYCVELCVLLLDMGLSYPSSVNQ